MVPKKFDIDTEASEVAEYYKDQIKGKVVLITGTTIGGVGYEAARVIALHEPKLLILAGRKQSVLDEAVATLATKNVRILLIDFLSFESVRKAAAEVNAYSESIDVLLLNHGAMIPNYTKSREGIEAMFTCNHLGTFLFANLVKEKVVGRLVMVGSGAHRFGGVQWDDISFEDGKTFDKMKGYAQSKTANHLFVKGWASHSKIPAFSLTPGAVWTGLGRNLSEEQKQDLGFFKKDGTLSDKFHWQTIERGAASHIVASFDKELLETPGVYLRYCQVADGTENQLAPHASNQENADRLWTMSEEMVGQKFS